MLLFLVLLLFFASFCSVCFSWLWFSCFRPSSLPCFVSFFFLLCQQFLLIQLDLAVVIFFFASSLPLLSLSALSLAAPVVGLCAPACSRRERRRRITKLQASINVNGEEHEWTRSEQQSKRIGDERKCEEVWEAQETKTEHIQVLLVFEWCLLLIDPRKKKRSKEGLGVLVCSCLACRAAFWFLFRFCSFCFLFIFIFSVCDFRSSLIDLVALVLLAFHRDWSVSSIHLLIPPASSALVCSFNFIASSSSLSAPHLFIPLDLIGRCRVILPVPVFRFFCAFSLVVCVLFFFFFFVSLPRGSSLSVPHWLSHLHLCRPHILSSSCLRFIHSLSDGLLWVGRFGLCLLILFKARKKNEEDENEPKSSEAKKPF